MVPWVEKLLLRALGVFPCARTKQWVPPWNSLQVPWVLYKTMEGCKVNSKMVEYQPFVVVFYCFCFQVSDFDIWCVRICHNDMQWLYSRCDDPTPSLDCARGLVGCAKYVQWEQFGETIVVKRGPSFLLGRGFFMYCKSRAFRFFLQGSICMYLSVGHSKQWLFPHIECAF